MGRPATDEVVGNGVCSIVNRLHPVLAIACAQDLFYFVGTIRSFHSSERNLTMEQEVDAGEQPVVKAFVLPEKTTIRTRLGKAAGLDALKPGVKVSLKLSGENNNVLGIRLLSR